MRHPEDVAGASLVVAVLADGSQVRVAPPGLAPIARVMGVTEEVTVFPPASCTVTTGWIGKVPVTPALVAPLGWVVNASLLAGPTTMLKLLLVAEASVPSLAANV